MATKPKKRGIPKRKRLRVGRIGFAVLLLILLALVIDYWSYPYGSDLAGSSSNRGENGLWLRYTWYFGQHPDQDVQVLGARLAREQIRYAYFHVRMIKRDGVLRYHHPEVASLNETLHKSDPEVRSVAWIYVDGVVDLNRDHVRANMVAEARWLTSVCGFDGVQWDYEPCHDGDQGFLRLLDESRAALPRSIISVASPTWFPWPLTSRGWTENYFGEVAQRCDQIVVMCYDTGFYTPRAYAWLVRQQAERIPKAAGTCRVLLGLPTYEKGGRSHNPHSENLRIALSAVRQSRALAGVALFADYTTDQAEWAWYDRAWLR